MAVAARVLHLPTGPHLQFFLGERRLPPSDPVTQGIHSRALTRDTASPWQVEATPDPRTTPPTHLPLPFKTR